MQADTTRIDMLRHQRLGDRLTLRVDAGVLQSPDDRVRARFIPAARREGELWIEGALVLADFSLVCVSIGEPAAQYRPVLELPGIEIRAVDLGPVDTSVSSLPTSALTIKDGQQQLFDPGAGSRQRVLRRLCRINSLPCASSTLPECSPALGVDSANLGSSCSGRQVALPTACPRPAVQQCRLMAGSASSQPHREAVFRREDLAGQGQLSATIGNSR